MTHLIWQKLNCCIQLLIISAKFTCNQLQGFLRKQREIRLFLLELKIDNKNEPNLPVNQRLQNNNKGCSIYALN